MRLLFSVKPRRMDDEDDEDAVLPLVEAASQGDVEEVEKIARASPASIEEFYFNRETPLWHGAKEGHSAVVEALIRMGADPDSGLLRKPLHEAVENGEWKHLTPRR